MEPTLASQPSSGPACSIAHEPAPENHPLKEALEKNPKVDCVEANAPVKISEVKEAPKASYIVALKKEFKGELETFAADANPTHQILKIINGFVCDLTQAEKDALEKNPKVDYVADEDLSTDECSDPGSSDDCSATISL